VAHDLVVAFQLVTLVPVPPTFFTPFTWSALFTAVVE
jgi:hypothetical protein